MGGIAGIDSAGKASSAGAGWGEQVLGTIGADERTISDDGGSNTFTDLSIVNPTSPAGRVDPSSHDSRLSGDHGDRGDHEAALTRQVPWTTLSVSPGGPDGLP